MHITNEQASTVALISFAVSTACACVGIVNFAIMLKNNRHANRIIATHKVADELFDRLRSVKQA